MEKKQIPDEKNDYAEIKSLYALVHNIQSVRDKFCPLEVAVQRDKLLMVEIQRAQPSNFRAQMLQNQVSAKMIQSICSDLEQFFALGLHFYEFPSNNLRVQEGRYYFTRKDLHKVASRTQILQADPQVFKARLKRMLNTCLAQILSRTVKGTVGFKDLSFPEFKVDSFVVSETQRSKVYRNSLCGEEVAVKVPKGEASDLVHEFKVLQSLAHRNVVRCLSLVELPEGRLGSIYQLCRPLSAADLTSERVWTVIEEILNGLQFLHLKGVCHFNLSPGHLLIADDDSVKISNFKLSCHVGKLRCPTGYQRNYASPEQLCNQNLGLHCDVWSFGMIVYWMAFRREPYRELAGLPRHLFLLEVLAKRRKPLVAESERQAQPELCQIMDWCWEDDWRSRASAAEISRRIKNM